MKKFSSSFLLVSAFLLFFNGDVSANFFSQVSTSDQQSIVRQVEIPALDLEKYPGSPEEPVLCRGVPTSLPVTQVDLLSDPFYAVQSIEVFSCDAIRSTKILFCDTLQQVKKLCPGYKMQQLYSRNSPAGIGRYPYPPGGVLLRVKYLNKDLVGQVPPVRLSLQEQDSGSNTNILNDDSFAFPQGSFLWEPFAPVHPKVSLEPHWKLSWAKGTIGTVSAVAVLDDEFVYVFHRAGRNWEMSTFNENFKMRNNTRLGQDTILKCYIQDGVCAKSFGSDMFLMPHGISVTPEKNLLVTDTGRHQVFMLDPEGKVLLEMGQDSIPGDDKTHFCQPADAEVDPISGLIFVADGYCNQRVAVFDQDGNFQNSIKDCNGKAFQVVHDLTIDAQRRVLFVADREHGAVCMYSIEEHTFGTFLDQFSMGESAVFALDYNPGFLYAVGINRKANQASGFIFSIQSDEEAATETSFYDFSMIAPHDVSVLENEVMFVSDLQSPQGVLKFWVETEEEIF